MKRMIWHKADALSPRRRKIRCCSAHETLMSHSPRRPSSAPPALGNAPPSTPPTPHPLPATPIMAWYLISCAHGSLQHSPALLYMLSRTRPVDCNSELHLTNDWSGKLTAVGLNNLGRSPWWPISACQSINWNPKRFNKSLLSELSVLAGKIEQREHKADGLSLNVWNTPSLSSSLILSSISKLNKHNKITPNCY